MLRKSPLMSSHSRRRVPVPPRQSSSNKPRLSQRAFTGGGTVAAGYYNTFTYVLQAMLPIRTSRIAVGLFQAYHLAHAEQAIYLPPSSLRETPFAVPPQNAVDFRAVCFCHHDVVDVGFVCSVCLSSTSSFHCPSGLSR